MTLFSNFELPLLCTRAPQGIQNPSTFPVQALFFRLHQGGWGLFIPLQGLRVWNPILKLSQTHRSSQPACHWSTGSHCLVSTDLNHHARRKKPSLCTVCKPYGLCVTCNCLHTASYQMCSIVALALK